MSDDLRAFTDAQESAVAEEMMTLLRHDVRNKLAGVRQAAYYLRMKSQPTELWEKDPRFARFHDLIEQQLELVDGLLTNYEGFGRLHVRMEVPLLPRRAVDLAVRAAALPDQVVVVREGFDPAPTLVDEAEVVVALRCLLENAAEAMPGGGGIRVSGVARDDVYVFSIVDEGPGLSVEDFRRYLRPLETGREGRRGLGLSVARRVASRHGGIVALGRSARGACVELLLKLSRLDEPADEPLDEGRASSPPSSRAGFIGPSDVRELRARRRDSDADEPGPAGGGPPKGGPSGEGTGEGT